MSGTYTKILYHVIFSTKKRVNMINSEIEERLIEYIGGIIRDKNGKLLAANTTSDYIHLYISKRTEPSIATILRLAKTNSSKWIHTTFPNLSQFAWQRGYGAFAVSFSKEEQVISYIKNQKEHHKKISFKEEFLYFLHKYKIEYDERYIWD